ncbi:MAG: hypothetical protein ACKN9S_14945 [Pirellula sp.]
MDWLSSLRTMYGDLRSLFGMIPVLWGMQLSGIMSACEPPSTVCIVVGASGESDYGAMFHDWGTSWLKSSEGLSPVRIGEGRANGLEQTEQRPADRDQLRQWIESVESVEKAGTCWLVLMGHGTYDGKESKFNLRGVDVSSTELGNWLKGSKHRWVIAVCASSSGPFLSALAGRDRVVITATKSGSETNFSRFGGFLADSMRDLTSDLDHDESISVLEAFIAASRKTERYYQEQKLLETEHPIMDDNGDGKGTSAEFYRGLRPIKRSEKGVVDGELARHIWLTEPKETRSLTESDKIQVEQIEKQIDALREKKATMPEEAYYMDLEQLLLELARVFYPSSK